MARLQLNEVMGEPLDSRFELTLPAATGAAAPPTRADLDAEALANRPDVIRAAAQERLAQESITAAKSAFYPQAAVQGVYEFNGGTFADRASSWTVGAVIRWNLFGGFADSAKLGEAKAAAARAHADRQRQESAARVDVRAALARLEVPAPASRWGASRLLRPGRATASSAIASMPDSLRSTTCFVLRSPCSTPTPNGPCCRDRCSHRAPRCSSGRVEGNAIMKSTFSFRPCSSQRPSPVARTTRPRKGQPDPRCPSRWRRAAEQDLATPFEVGGAIRAQRVAVIVSPIMADVRAVPVKAGDRVRAGQALVLLDGRGAPAHRPMHSAAQAAMTQPPPRFADRLPRSGLALHRLTQPRIRT